METASESEYFTKIALAEGIKASDSLVLGKIEDYFGSRDQIYFPCVYDTALDTGKVEGDKFIGYLLLLSRHFGPGLGEEPVSIKDFWNNNHFDCTMTLAAKDQASPTIFNEKEIVEIFEKIEDAEKSRSSGLSFDMGLEKQLEGIAEHYVMKIRNVSDNGKPVDTSINVDFGPASESDAITEELNALLSKKMAQDAMNRGAVVSNAIVIPGFSRVIVDIKDAKAKPWSGEDPLLNSKMEAGVRIGKMILNTILTKDNPKIQTIEVLPRTTAEIMKLADEEHHPSFSWVKDLF